MTPGEALTARLGGRWHGTYGEARCPVHDDRTPSLSVRDGDRSPLVKCHRGCDPRQIVTALRRAGHWPDGQSTRLGGTAADRRKREDATRGYVLELWQQARSIAGTPAEFYLRNRGISGALPPSLRYHAGLKYSEGLVLPAMVALVQAPDRNICGLHRTFLREGGSDKASVPSPRKILGKVRGGAVRLAAGEAAIAVGEGLETCLSFQRASGIATWAALSAAGITAIVLPPPPLATTVYLLVDLDAAGEEACAAAAERLTREGRKVKLARPTAGKDFNDAVREAAHAR